MAPVFVQPLAEMAGGFCFDMKDIIRFFKLVILSSFAVAFALLSYTFYDAYMSRRILAPKPPPTAHDLAVAARWVEVWFYVKIGFVVLSLFACYGLIMRFLVVPAINARERINYDPDTGMLPMVRRNVAPWWKRAIGHNEYDEVDGNLAATPHRKVWSNGRLAVDANTHGVNPDAQMDYARGSWSVQGSVARKGRGMTVGEARLISGEFHAKALLARERVEQMREKRYVLNHPTAVLPAPGASALSLSDAIAQSDANNWIIGQATELQPVDNPGAVGALSIFKPRNGHAAIIGGTGSGKTASTGLLFAFYARKFGYHPIVLDGKNGIDWRPLQGIVEWHNMDVESFEWQIESLTAIFNERWQLLEKSGSAKTIYRLPAQQRPTPIIIIAEEFGDIWTEVLGARDKAERHRLTQSVNHLFRMCRATGITLCLIDQAPEKWSQQMRGNAKFVACYKLKGGVANAFNEYHADKLPDVGMYSQDNVFYRPWHTEEEIDISRMFPPLERTLLARQRTSTNVSVPVVRTAMNGNWRGEGSVQNSMIPLSLKNAFVRSGNWAEFCEGYFRLYPNTRQSELRRVMAEVDGNSRDPGQFKGVAFEMYHRFSPNGDRSKFYE